MSKSEIAPPLILTLRMDEHSQEYFNVLRRKHFPKQRNYLQAHLTLFHHLKENQQTIDAIRAIRSEIFDLQFTGLKFLGGGVAYAAESEPLMKIRHQIADALLDQLIPQDRQGYRPHITVQNKVSFENAKTLFEELKATFRPISITAYGLDLWQYLGGPWRHHSHHPFQAKGKK